MATKLCAYESNNVRCKNYFAPQDEEDALCPVHKGVIKRELSPAEIAHNQRYQNHESIAEGMNNEDLAKHILQLESLLEDVKLRQQAAASVKAKRIRAAEANGVLTEAQKNDIATLRGGRAREIGATSGNGASQPKVSKEEKEIQKLLKLGLTREKAIKMLGLDE